MSTVTIVQETAEHFDAIRRLTVEAFDASEFGHNGEAELIEQIRDQCEDMISLVAIVDDQPVGSIVFSNAAIRCPESTILGMGLGPLAVQPQHQNQEVGSMLIREGLRLVVDSGFAFTLVAGHPAYYPRFGFLPAHQFSVTHGFTGMPQEMLFIHCSDSTLPGKMMNGRAYYHQAFGPQFGE